MAKTVVIYADESMTHDLGLAHSRFFGGTLVRAEDRDRLVRDLEEYAAEAGIVGEVKWRKVRPFNVKRIRFLIDLFFDMIEGGLLKLRVMWLPQNTNDPPRTSYYREHGYYIQYYFFVVDGFGLAQHDEPTEVQVEFFPDTLPQEPEKKRKFKRFLMAAHNSPRYKNRSPFRIVQVSDVDSKKHILLQCSDVVIGALGFLANGHDKAKQRDGSVAYGTQIKARFARHVFQRLQRIHREQCGYAYRLTESTQRGKDEFGHARLLSSWEFAYRQWLFGTKPTP